MKLRINCTVEPTKSEKWFRLEPTERGPVGAINIKAEDAKGKKTATVTIDLS